MSNVFNKYQNLKKVGAFRASLRLLRDPNASNTRKAAIIGATLVGIIYTVVPEPTDLIPVLGYIDEGLMLLAVRFIAAWLAKQYRQMPIEHDRS